MTTKIIKYIDFLFFDNVIFCYHLQCKDKVIVVQSILVNESRSLKAVNKFSKGMTKSKLFFSINI